MNIKGIEVDFDFFDADDVEKIEREFERVQNECKKRKSIEMPASQIIREECKIIDIFIDNVFGKGIAEKIFKGKSNIKQRMEIFTEIANEHANFKNDIQDTLARYKPRG